MGWFQGRKQTWQPHVLVLRAPQIAPTDLGDQALPLTTSFKRCSARDTCATCSPRMRATLSSSCLGESSSSCWRGRGALRAGQAEARSLSAYLLQHTQHESLEAARYVAGRDGANGSEDQQQVVWGPHGRVKGPERAKPTVPLGI